MITLISGCIETTTWAYEQHNNRVKITIPEEMISGTLSDFPLYLGYISHRDAMFTTLDGTKLDFERIYDYGGTSETPKYWVEIPTLSDTNNEIYMYYDGPIVSSPSNLWSDYTGVWHFEEFTGVYKDSSPNRLDILETDINVATRENTGYLGACPKFVGTHTLEVQHNDVLEHPNLHIEMWVQTDDATTERAILGWEQRLLPFEETNPDRGWNIELGWNKNDITVQNGVYGFGVTASDSNSFSDNTWHYLVVDYVDNGLVHIYVDGVETSVYTTTPYGTHFFDGWTPHEDATLMFGGNSFSNALNLNGYIDEVRISNNPKDSDWASTTYKNQLNDYPVLYGEIETR